MRAVVLVGGEGTRLRPLTETVPKPLLPLVDRPFLDHVLAHLGRHGIEEALLSSPYLGQAFASFLEGRGDRRPRIRWVEEDVPLGTGGAVANAGLHLEEPFLVLNGDILTDLDLSALASFHARRGGVATIALVRVPDARPYGLVTTDAGGRILEFREKPQEPGPGLVNAGTYVLNREAVRTVPPGRPVSIERETFPELLAARRPVHGFVVDGYWMDVGTPEKYLRATFDALDGKVGGLDYAAPYLHPAARVSLTARLGRWTVVSEDVAVEDDAEVEDSVLLEGSIVRPGARVRASVLGPRSTVGARAVVDEAVLGEGAAVADGATSRGARVPVGGVLEG